MSDLSNTLREYTKRWALTDVQPILPDNSRGGTDLLAHAVSPDHGEVLLKIATHHPRLPAEMATLAHFNGKGAARVFEQAPQDGLYLMQALRPGRQLSALCHEGRDDDATKIVAELIRTLTDQGGDEVPSAVPPVENLLVHFNRFQADTVASNDVRTMVTDGETAFRAMLSQPYKPVVVHGDLHHFNILEHGNSEWLAIDPHGYIGPPIFEVGAMMKNPWPGILDAPDMAALMARRINILADELDWPAEEVASSAFVYAVISLLWDMETNDKPSDFVPVVECLHQLVS